MGHLNSFSASEGGDLNENFLKIQMPGGGMCKLRFDWYIIIRTNICMVWDKNWGMLVSHHPKISTTTVPQCIHNALTVPVGLSKIPTSPLLSTSNKVCMKSSWMSYGEKGNGKNTGFLSAAGLIDGDWCKDNCFKSQLFVLFSSTFMCFCAFSIPKDWKLIQEMRIKVVFWFPNFAHKSNSLALMCGNCDRRFSWGAWVGMINSTFYSKILDLSYTPKGRLNWNLSTL